MIHIAVQPVVRRSFLDAPRETFETDMMGTVTLLAAMGRQESLRVVVDVRSDKCRGNREWEWSLRDGEALGGHEPFSASKARAETVGSAFRRSFFAQSDTIRLTSARASNVTAGWPGALTVSRRTSRSASSRHELRVRKSGAIRPWHHFLNPFGGYFILAQSLCETPAHAKALNSGPTDADACAVGGVVERLGRRWPRGLTWAVDGRAHRPQARLLKLDFSRATAPGLGSERWSRRRDRVRRRAVPGLHDEAHMREATRGQVEGLTRTV